VLFLRRFSRGLVVVWVDGEGAATRRGISLRLDVAAALGVAGDLDVAGENSGTAAEREDLPV